MVDAIKRYDRGLDVRWSWERKKWCLEARMLRPDLMPKPVKWVFDGGRQVEKLLPLYSDRRICFERGTHIVCWFTTIDRPILDMLVESDVGRLRRRRDFLKQVEISDALEEKEAGRFEADHRREAYKFFRWACNRTVMSY